MLTGGVGDECTWPQAVTQNASAVPRVPIGMAMRILLHKAANALSLFSQLPAGTVRCR
jgi:hypothetical protein